MVRGPVPGSAREEALIGAIEASGYSASLVSATVMLLVDGMVGNGFERLTL